MYLCLLSAGSHPSEKLEEKLLHTICSALWFGDECPEPEELRLFHPWLFPASCCQELGGITMAVATTCATF